MVKMRFNWTMAIVFVIALIVLAITAFGLRKWQVTRMGSKALKSGLKSYENFSWEDAAENLGRYLSVNPSDVEIMLKYAEAQLHIRPLKRANIQQAVAAYRSVLRVEKDNAAATEKLVSLYLQMNIPTEAELIAKRYLEMNEGADIRRMLAISLAGQRRFKESASELKAVIEVHPELITAYETLGILSERYPDDFGGAAEQWFGEAVKNNPESAHAFIIRGAFYLRSDKIAQAITDFEEAQRLDLSDSAVRLRLATEFINAGKFEQAQSHLMEIEQRDPGNEMLWQVWAKLVLKTNSEKEMLGIAQRGLEHLTSQPWDFMPVASELFIRSGEFDRAEDCILKLKQKDIEPAQVAFLEGLLAGIRKQNHEAIMFWRKAVQLGDKSERTLLSLAEAFADSGDNQSAILQLRALVSEQPHSVRGHVELAKLLGQSGKLAEAAEQTYLAIQVAPHNLDAALLYIQARILLAGGDKSDISEQILKNMESRLAELEILTGGVFEVRVLQFQLAIRQKEFTRAEQLLMQLKSAGDDRVEAALAEVNLLEAKDSFDEAVARLNVLIDEKFPENIFLLKYLANLLAEQGRRDECERVLFGALQSTATAGAKRELGLALIKFYNRWGQENKSCQLLAKLSEEIVWDIPIKRHLLRCEMVRKDFSLAQQIVDEIRSIEGSDGWQWRCEQANIWFNAINFNERYPQIVSLLKENLTNNPDDQTSRMLLAQTYEKADKTQLAVTTYREAFNRSPEEVRVIVPIVAALYKANEYEQAEKILSAVAKLKLTTDPELSRLEFQSCLQRGELNSAEDILEKLLAQEPNNPDTCFSLALLKIQQLKYDQASELLDKLRVQNPDSVSITSALVELNVCRKNKEEALRYCNEMLEKSGDARAYILRGRTYSMLGENELARLDFERALSLEPDNVQAWVFKSEFAWSIGCFEEGVKDIQKALSLDPENTHVQKRAIAFLLSCGDSEHFFEGRRLLDSALSSNPQDTELLLYKCQCLRADEKTEMIEDAIRILQGITEQQPKISNAWRQLAEVYLERSQPGKAMDVIMRGLTYTPKDKFLLLLKARAEAARAPTLAIPTLRALREREPDDIEIALELSDMYIKAGQFDKGIALLQKLLIGCGEKNQRRVETALAVAMYKSGDKVEADEHFQNLSRSGTDDAEALLAQVEVLKGDHNWAMLNDRVDDWFTHNPRDVRILVAVARNLAATENRSARSISEDLLRKILDHDPDCLAAINTLAMLLQITDRAAESAMMYRRLLAIDPKNVIAVNNLAWLMCEHEGRYEEALELAQEGIKTSPEYADLIDTRGVIYYRLGEYQKAVEDFIRCIQLHPKNSISLTASHFHLGRALAAIEDSDGAVDNLRIAIELNAQVGGLSEEDITEAQSLLRELLQEKNHARITY